jgi:transcription elongation factor Elf1
MVGYIITYPIFWARKLRANLTISFANLILKCSSCRNSYLIKMENEDPLLVYNKFLDIENEVRKYVKFQGNENRH